MKSIASGAVAALLALVSSAHAAIAGFEYVGTFSGNDSLAAINDIVDPDVDLFLGKLDCNNDACSSTAGTDGAVDADVFTIINISLDDGEAKSGEFTFAAGSGATLEYMAVKAGPQFALYRLLTPATSGTFAWNTMDLRNRGLSHLSWYGSVDTDPIPLPAAGLLFLGGLAALRGSRRLRA